MKIKLSTMEMILAGNLGMARHMQSVSRKPSHDMPPELSLENHTTGAIGEFAAAKALGLYPGFTVNNFDGPDIQPNIQVRATHKGRLILTNRDKSNEKFVLVLGYGPDLDVAGWIWGHEGKQDKWLTDVKNGRPPAYFIPTDALRPIETLNES